MNFISIEFIFFFSVVFLTYWFVFSKNLFIQNFLLLFAGYLFYASWSLQVLIAIFTVSFLNYITGVLITCSKSDSLSRLFFYIGIFINLGVLVYFKYYNFFVDSFISLISKFINIHSLQTINIILPVGISFFIFLSLSYIIDIYRGNLKASRNIVNVLLTLSFFPIILAGPIQRPISLLPQIQNKRIFDYNSAVIGLKRILWGFFMKTVIADNCAVYVNEIFDKYNYHSGSTLLIGAILYTFQIYADFAGYSYIAIGISNLLGFELMKNFNYPYFSKNIIEFWQRWHISLTKWFRDYIFLPIAYKFTRYLNKLNPGSKNNDMLVYSIAILVTWTLTGLWHGGNFTFILWGLINGFFLIIYRITQNPKNKLLRKLNIDKNSILVVSIERGITILMIITAWIFFRSNTSLDALNYVSGIINMSLFSVPEVIPVELIIILIFFVIIEWTGRFQNCSIEKIGQNYSKLLRWSFYTFILFFIYFFGNFSGKIEFIYFQF